jgi:hypothetical protein
MSTASGLQHEEWQQSPQIEPTTSTLQQTAVPAEVHPPAPRGSGSLRRGELRARDSMSFASEYVAEIGSHSPYSPSAKQSFERSARSSQTHLSVSSHQSLGRSSQRSSAATSFESFGRSDGNTHGLEMREQFADAPARFSHEAMNEKQVVTNTGMSSVDDIPERDVLHYQTSSPASKGAPNSPSTVMKAGIDSGYSSGTSTHRISQDTSSVVTQSEPTSRKNSATDLTAAEGAEKKTTATTTHNSRQANSLNRNRSMTKIERLTGESLEYLNYPIIGNKTQNVILPKSSRSQLKLEKITGESLESLSYPVVGVVPQWQTISRSRRRLEGRKSVESVTSESDGEVNLRRTRSWKGSVRDSLHLIRSTPSSRSASPERGSPEFEPEPAVKQRKKLQKRRPSSKDLSNFQSFDDVPRVPTPVQARFQKRPATSPTIYGIEQPCEDTITGTPNLSSMRSSLSSEIAESGPYFPEPRSYDEHEAQAPAPTRRPSFFRRGRKRDDAPKDEDYELTGVVAVGFALGGTPYDIAMSPDNRKSLERIRSRSGGPKHPHHFANLSSPTYEEETVIERPISTSKHDHADPSPISPADQSQPTPVERQNVAPCAKRESVWIRDVVAAANKGLPAELPPALIAGQSAALPVEAEPSVELMIATAVEPPTAILPTEPVELPAELPAELLAELPFVENQIHALKQDSTWATGRRSRNAFYSNYQNFSSPHVNPPKPTKTNARPSSSPATIISYASGAGPAIILTSASPSPPPSPQQSPQRPKSTGHLNRSWKLKPSVSATIERESAEWSRLAQEWRDKHDRARITAQNSTVVPVQESSAAAAVVSPIQIPTAIPATEEVYDQGSPNAPMQGASAVLESVNSAPVLETESGTGRYYAQLAIQNTPEAAETISPAPALSAEMGSGRYNQSIRNNAFTPQFSARRETRSNRRNFGLVRKPSHITAL